MATKTKSLELQDIDGLNEAYLICEIARHITISFDRRVKHMGLTRAQWRLLSILRRSQGITQKKISELMEIKPITIVKLLDRMEKAGWIVRKADPKDRRANLIYLTGKVDSYLKEMRKISLKLRQDITAGMESEDHMDFLKQLNLMKKNICTISNEKNKN